MDRPITSHTTPCWYQLPFLTQSNVFNETLSKPRQVQLQKSLKKMISQEAMCLEYKQAVGMRERSGPVVNHFPTGYQQPPPSRTQFNYGWCSKNRVTGNIYNSNSNCVCIPFHRKSLPYISRISLSSKLRKNFLLWLG